MFFPVHFANDKYRRWYLSLIEKAKQNPPLMEDGERHHILPRSLGGVDVADNIVVISYREHYIAHWLLTKFTYGLPKRKMNFAFARMAGNPGYRRIAGWQVLRSKQAHRDAMRGRSVSAETRSKMSAAAKQRSPEYRAKQRIAQTGRKHSAETRAKLSAITKALHPAKRAAMDEARRGFRHSPEARARMSTSQMGHYVSREHREKTRRKLIGNKNGIGKRNAETAARISAALLGHAVSEKVKDFFKSVSFDQRRLWAKQGWIKRRARLDAEREDIQIRRGVISDLSS